MTGITNLIQYDYTNDKTVNEQLRKIKGSTLNQTITITTESGVSFTKNPYDKKSNSTTIEAKTPKNGTYFITLENGNDSDIQIIQKIVFKKGIENVNKALTIYSLPENILQNKITEIPYYAFGKISYITEKDIQSVNEGHSPWKTTPLLAAEILTTNLIPKNVDKKQVSYVVTHESNSKKANEVTVVEMKVPGFGVYNITLRYPDKSPISFITQITFEPSYDFQP
ncbi:hypothetical protein D3C73_838080 [compost metagenome]